LAITESQILGGAGTVAQYIRGDGSLADFPATTGGGSSVSYYLNGSVSQGTIGGVAYLELNRMPIFGAGTDFTRNSDGYIASFITDAGDPNKLEIPAGNWNLETYFSASSGGGSPTFYVELYKYDGTTFTLIASNSGSPELIAFGTNINPYFSTLAVPQTVLTLTDRLALRYYVNTSGRTITLHTENNHLCQVITTFTTGLTALNGLTTQVQFFAVGTSGTDFNIASSVDTHTFNLPTASGTNRGALSSADWSTFNNKENAITAGTTAQYFRGDKTFQTLNTSVVPEGTNLYYTEARVNANTNVAANTAARHNAVTLGTANGLSLSTQVLSLGLASAGVTGALSGTDWTTFNNKQNALTNPVTGTGTTNYLPKFTGSTTVGNSQVFDNGTNVGIGTTSPNANLEISVPNSLGSFAKFRLNSPYYNYWEFINNSALEINRGGSTHLTISNVGNLLVGTTTDNGAKLQVNGAGNTALNVSGNGYSIFQSSAHTYTPNAIGLSVGYNRSGANGETTLVWGAPASGFNFEIASVLSGIITPRLTITNTGSATFSSSVTATSFSLGSGNGQLVTSGFWGTQITAGTGSFANFALLDSATNGIMYNRTGTLNMIFAGNVGIGTSSPASRLQIEGTGTGAWLTINRTDSGTNVIDYTQSGTRLGYIGYIVNDLFINNSTASSTVFFTAGAERMRISSTGFVSAGAVTNGRLGVRGFTNDSSGYAFEAANASGNTLFIVRNDGVSTFTGNVGIGTYSPSQALDVYRDTSTASYVVARNGSGVQAAIGVAGDNGSLLGTLSNHNLRIITNGAVVATIATTGAATFEGTIFGKNNAVYQNSSTFILNVGSDQAMYGGTNSDGGIFVYGNNKLHLSTNSARRLTIDGSGNVGIGTSSPNRLLTVSGTQGLIALNATSYRNTTIGSDSVGNFIVYDDTAAAYRMVINSSGNVLIGTTTDNGAKLNVNGTIRTANPTGSTSDGWLLGRALVSGTSSPDRWIRVQIGNLYYDILAVYMGSV
jgi:hypothetical protein